MSAIQSEYKIWHQSLRIKYFRNLILWWMIVDYQPISVIVQNPINSITFLNHDTGDFIRNNSVLKHVNAFNLVPKKTNETIKPVSNVSRHTENGHGSFLSPYWYGGSFNYIYWLFAYSHIYQQIHTLIFCLCHQGQFWLCKIFIEHSVDTSKWSEYLAIFLLRLRSAHNECIKSTTAEMVYGTSLRLPRLFPIRQQIYSSSFSYGSLLIQQIVKLHFTPTFSYSIFDSQSQHQWICFCSSWQD